MKAVNFAVMGGDSRCAELANFLAKDGYNTFAFGFDYETNFIPSVKVCSDITTTLPLCERVVLPLPITNDKIHLFAPFSQQTYPLVEIYQYIKKDALVFGGKVSGAIAETAKEFGITIEDYLQREEFAVLNAVATAEGAVQIAMEKLPFTIHGSRCLVTGFGRISKVLVKVLGGMGANISVAARNVGQLAWADIYGCKSYNIKSLKDICGDFDIIFNTIPSMLFDKQLLQQVNDDCLLIDLASAPGGIDGTAAKLLGKRVIVALSLPGKVAPVTSGKIIKDTILNICMEKQSDCEA